MLVILHDLSCGVKKSTFGVSDHVQFNSTCTVTEKYYVETCHETFDSRIKRIFIHGSKISAVTARLICVFVFAVQHLFRPFEVRNMIADSSKPNKLRNVYTTRSTARNVTIQKRKVYYISKSKSLRLSKM